MRVVEEWRIVTRDRHVLRRPARTPQLGAPPVTGTARCRRSTTGRRRARPGRGRADPAAPDHRWRRRRGRSDRLRGCRGSRQCSTVGPSRRREPEAEPQPSRLGAEVDELGGRDGAFSARQTQADDGSIGRLDDAQRRLGFGPPEVADRVHDQPNLSRRRRPPATKCGPHGRRLHPVPHANHRGEQHLGVDDVLGDLARANSAATNSRSSGVRTNWFAAR